MLFSFYASNIDGASAFETSGPHHHGASDRDTADSIPLAYRVESNVLSGPEHLIRFQFIQSTPRNDGDSQRDHKS